MKWLLTKYSPDEFSEVYFQKDAGYHVMDMYMGDPAQLVYGIFDTGSDIVWIQCTRQTGQKKFPYYKYSKSDTYKNVQCDDKQKCNTDNTYILGCKSLPNNCEFKATYGDATSAFGVMATDIITFKPEWEIFHDFIFGCSLKNSNSMMGVIGEFSTVSTTYRKYWFAFFFF